MAQTTNVLEREIEVSYLPTRLPEGLTSTKPMRIVDVYLSSDADLTNKLRLRQKGDKYEFTKKVNLDPADLSVQNEYTIPLTKKEFETLRKAGGREIVKDRYFVPVGEHTAEVDVLRGELEGFVMIEVEFKSEADRDAFIPPEYFGSDITQEDFIAGSYLAGKTLADIQPHLERLEYKSLEVQ
jgi:adenylate cyclase